MKGRLDMGDQTDDARSDRLTASTFDVCYQYGIKEFSVLDCGRVEHE